MSQSGLHGRKKESFNEDAYNKKIEREASAIHEYQSLCQKIYVLRNDSSQDSETIALTKRILNQNPEFYTMWNIRREALRRYFETLQFEDILKECTHELSFTETCLRSHPKSYWVWNHRRWILETIPTTTESPSTAWKQELKLVNYMLDKDPRNFHGWGYRRYVVDHLPDVTEKHEYEYTTTKIYQNFSNFSAWHYRSKLMKHVFSEMEMPSVIEQELDLVRNAIFTEPSDQSAWFYQRFLLGSSDPITIQSGGLSSQPLTVYKREIESIEELLDVEPDCKFALLALIYMYKVVLEKEPLSQEHVSYKSKIQAFYQRLEKLDPDRAGYYQDQLNMIM